MSHPKCQNLIHEEHMHRVVPAHYFPVDIDEHVCINTSQVFSSLSFPINSVSRSPQEVVVNNSFAMDRMKCDPELSLRLGRAQDLPLGNSTSEQQQQQQKQITVFYNSQICVCDVTEMQAIAIISTAKRAVHMEEGDAHNKKKNTNNSIHQYKQRVVSQALPSSPQMVNSVLSMKRSLQRFLQKRKTRMTSVSPYENRRQLLASNMSSFR